MDNHFSLFPIQSIEGHVIFESKSLKYFGRETFQEQVFEKPKKVHTRISSKYSQKIFNSIGRTVWEKKGKNFLKIASEKFASMKNVLLIPDKQASNFRFLYSSF